MDTETNHLQGALKQASTYEEWLRAATALDKLDGLDKWRLKKASTDFDYRLLASRVALFRKLRKQRDYDRLIFCLREELHGNLGNMANPALYQRARSGTRILITDYLDEVSDSLNLLCDTEVKALPLERKARFFRRSARSFGRSALLLSGGASLGLFHLGVIGELVREELLPNVITGSSAGAVIGAIIATRSDAELDPILEQGYGDYEWVRRFGISDMIRGKGLLDQRRLQRSIRRNIPEMTFLEAYEHTHRILNVSVSPAEPNQFPRLLNYLTAPNVLIRRAVLASSAIPGLFPSVQLRAKNFEGKSVAYMARSRWIDGSIHEDIPKSKVNRLHNVNHYIVSQANPHVVPFLSDGLDEVGLIPFIQDVMIKAPLVQLEHLLELAQQHFDVPGLGTIIKQAHGVISQGYRGDITVYPERQLGKIDKIFANATVEQASELIWEGRRATWPRVERIRNSTQISRTFDACLRRLG